LCSLQSTPGQSAAFQDRTYALSMLRRMRDETGGPNIKTRLVALLAAVGLLVVTAPAVVPLVRWIADQIW
jgi:hypothetical protein